MGSGVDEEGLIRGDLVGVGDMDFVLMGHELLVIELLGEPPSDRRRFCEVAGTSRTFWRTCSTLFFGVLEAIEQGMGDLVDHSEQLDTHRCPVDALDEVTTDLVVEQRVEDKLRAPLAGHREKFLDSCLERRRGELRATIVSAAGLRHGVDVVDTLICSLAILGDGVLEKLTTAGHHSNRVKGLLVRSLNWSWTGIGSSVKETLRMIGSYGRRLKIKTLLKPIMGRGCRVRGARR